MGRKMKQPPVYFTIGQVQHNPLLNLAAYVPTIQESLRKVGYPDFKQGVQVQFDIAAAAGSKEAEQTAAPVTQRVEKYMFLNAEGTRCMLMQTNAVSFQTTEYDTFEVFLAELRKGLLVLSNAVGGLSYMERVGLRYLDAVVPGVGENLNQYLVAEVMGLPSRLPDETFLYSFAETTMLAKGVGQVVSRTVIQNSPLGFPADLRPDAMKVGERFRAVSGEHAVIDTDGSLSERLVFNVDDVEKRLMGLHDLIDKCFRANVTDHARASWGA